MNSDPYTIEEEDEASGPQGNSGADALLKRLGGRIGDVRIHDSRQAGELARRLGARAFTAGRDVYVQPELLRPFTPESAALLEHELFHVAEQTGMPMPTQDMTLLRPSLGASARRGSAAAPAMPARPAAPATRSIRTPAAPPKGMPAVQRFQAGQSGSEASAERVEATSRQESGKKQKQARKAAPDPEEIADRIYELMRRDLLLEHERGLR